MTGKFVIIGTISLISGPILMFLGVAIALNSISCTYANEICGNDNAIINAIITFIVGFLCISFGITMLILAPFNQKNSVAEQIKYQ